MTSTGKWSDLEVYKGGAYWLDVTSKLKYHVEIAVVASTLPHGTVEPMRMFEDFLATRVPWLILGRDEVEVTPQGSTLYQIFYVRLDRPIKAEHDA